MRLITTFLIIRFKSFYEYFTATGEPVVDSAFALVLAMRNAIAAARKDVGNEEWFEISELFNSSQLNFYGF